MSAWYSYKGTRLKVLRHLDGNDLVLCLYKHREKRVSVSEEIADIVEQMIEFAFLNGKETVRNEIKSKLGLGE